jgi:site-specific recombinase XerD
MTLRERIVDQIALTISDEEAYNANVCLGLLITHFSTSLHRFLSATSEELAEFLTCRGNAATTVARRLSTLRNIFSVLLQWGLIAENPAIGVARPAIAEKASDFDVPAALVDRLIGIQKAVAERVRKALAYTEQLTLALIYLVASGAFLAEIEALVIQDLRRDHITVGRGTPRERLIWLSSDAEAAINAVVHAGRPLPPDPNSPLLVNRFGLTVDTQIAWNMLQRAIVRADMAQMGLTPGKIHRSAAASLLECGLGWNIARHPSKYLRIPSLLSKPPFEKLEEAVERYHPLESV